MMHIRYTGVQYSCPFMFSVDSSTKSMHHVFITDCSSQCVYNSGLNLSRSTQQPTHQASNQTMKKTTSCIQTTSREQLCNEVLKQLQSSNPFSPTSCNYFQQPETNVAMDFGTPNCNCSPTAQAQGGCSTPAITRKSKSSWFNLGNPGITDGLTRYN